MRRLSLKLFALLTLSAAGSVNAYDSQVHAYEMYQGYLMSQLGNVNNPPLLQQLGLDRLDAPQPFSPYWVTSPLPLSGYYDNAGADSNKLEYVRFPVLTEWWQMQELQNVGVFGSNGSNFVGQTSVQTLPIGNWLMRGVIREDDLIQKDYKPSDGPLPDIDPRGEFRRVFNHFYDPINNRMLTVGVSCSSWSSGAPFYAGPYCGKSIDWGLGTIDAFTSLSPDPNHANHFSWEDARQNEFLALVGERDANSNGFREAAERQVDSQERLFRWATAFRSLGDVIHLLQDAAQPQHSRNDRHDYHTSPDEHQAFEPFTTARLLGIPASGQRPPSPTGGQNYVYNLTGAQIKAYMTPLLGAAGYTEPTFMTPLRFFTSRAPGDTASTSPANRVGLADYSNRGFFTRGTLPGTTNFLFPPIPVGNGVSGYTATNAACSDLPELAGQAITCTTYYHTVPDVVAPSRSDVTTAQPLVSDGMWKGVFSSSKEFTLSPAIFQAQGDLTIPRAIAYSAGMIDYFFRGKLTVSAPADKIVAVLNQGAQHTMNSQGYPCAGTATNDGCAIFGFQSIRVSVKNATASITESGTGTVDAQKLAATVAGSINLNSTGPYLVAVAKYHRNTCYKSDLSGEPYQAYATPPLIGVITQPTCSGGQTTRTTYQEISVSKSVALTSTQINATTAFDVHFDFSSDPIPVNATDLFIQVVYRGPMGDPAVAQGQEPDAIAVGTLDVREPTFAAFWNNTDYFWNSGWVHENSTYHNEGIETFWSCMGGFPVKMVFEYDGGVGTPAMIDPISGSNVPGMVRLGVLFPPPDFAGQLKNIQGTPVHFPGDALIPIETGMTSGMFRQANLENIAASTLTAPYAGCANGLPNAPQYWCFDPIQRRRAQLLGTPAVPFYLAPFGGAGSASDVDSASLPAFVGTVALATGTVRFDTDATLASCTTQPASAPITADYQGYAHYVELLEEARDLGVSGETEQPAQQERPAGEQR
jgi:hypothetical protein